MEYQKPVITDPTMTKQEIADRTAAEVAEFMSSNFVKVTVRTSNPAKGVTNPELAKRIAAAEGTSPKKVSGRVELRDAGDELSRSADVTKKADAYAKSMLEPFSVKRIGKSKEGILSVQKMQEFDIEMQRLVTEHDNVLNQTQHVYAGLVAAKQRELGTALDGYDVAKAYPSFEQWRSGAGISYDIEPLAGHQVDPNMSAASRACVEVIVRQQEKRVQNILFNAFSDTTKVLESAFKSSSFGKTNGGRKPKVYEGTSDKLAEAAERLRSFNVYRDHRITKLCDQLVAAAQYQAEDVISSDAVRAEWHDKVCDAQRTVTQCTSIVSEPDFDSVELADEDDSDGDNMGFDF